MKTVSVIFLATLLYAENPKSQKIYIAGKYNLVTLINVQQLMKNMKQNY